MVRGFGSVLLFAALALPACGGSGVGGTGGGAGGMAGGGAGAGGGSAGSGGTPGNSGGAGGGSGSDMGVSHGPRTIQKVFIVLMENANWTKWKGSSSAPYLNTKLLPMGAHAEAYNNPPKNHPSLPNYIWLEAGSNLGVTADGTTAQYHQGVTDHFVNQLEAAGHTWKAYVENIDGSGCPLTDSGLFVARHVPMLYFDDVTNSNDVKSARCKAHIRPFSELEADLKTGATADYNFITPNLCNDAHGSNVLGGDFTCSPPPIPGSKDLINLGDTFLSTTVPMITGSAGFGTHSLVIVTWDEGDASLSDGPIGFIAVGAMVKAGYSNSLQYDHSSTLRSLELIFGAPYLRGAQNATDLSDLFTSFP